jgi:hypothetical protein
MQLAHSFIHSFRGQRKKCLLIMSLGVDFEVKTSL